VWKLEVGIMAAETKRVWVRLEGLLKWYEHFKYDPRSQEVIDALIEVPGGATVEEKIQIIRDEIAAGRKEL